MATTFVIIDDDLDDVDLFTEALRDVDPGIVCWKETDPAKALKSLRSTDCAKPEVIFVDINMPVLSGWEVLLALKRSSLTRHIPVIMFSTSTSNDDISKARALGASCFITKPNSYDALVRHLNLIYQSVKAGSLNSNEVLR
jgi:CheY-like chemotaxis protein